MNFKKIVFFMALLFSMTACDKSFGVKGVVRDSMGAPLSGVIVDFYYPDSDKLLTEITDEEGAFQMSYISAGDDQDGFVFARLEGYMSLSKPYIAGSNSPEITLVMERLE